MSELEREVAELGEGVSKLLEHRVMRSHATFPRLLLFNFLRGLAFGLGSVVGATALVSVVVYMLSSIDFIPVIGEWATEIIRVIDVGGSQ